MVEKLNNNSVFFLIMSMLIIFSFFAWGCVFFTQIKTNNIKNIVLKKIEGVIIAPSIIKNRYI